MTQPLRILIADDHAIARQGLRTVLLMQHDMQLVGEATNGREAVAATAALRPDVVLMDLMMPVLDGVAAIAAIKREQPATHILALTTFADTELVVGAVQAGVDGYLIKDIGIEELTHAIRTVHSGAPYLHRDATRQLLQATAAPDEPSPALTGREQQVLTLLAAGRTNRMIALQLRIAEKTVSVHVSKLLAKLGFQSRTQAALYASRLGLTET